MAEQNRESSMEEILSSIKRIIAEDKTIDADRPAARRKPVTKPALQAVPDPVADDNDSEVLELTNALSREEPAAAADGLGDQRKQERLINDQKLIAMRKSLSALVDLEQTDSTTVAKPSGGTSLEDMTREMMRPMLKQWLDDNLPSLVEELVAREIRRIGNS